MESVNPVLVSISTILVRSVTAWFTMQAYMHDVYTDVILFSFGQNVGDDLVPMEDDGSSPLIVLREPFNIFQEKESDLFVR